MLGSDPRETSLKVVRSSESCSSCAYTNADELNLEKYAFNEGSVAARKIYWCDRRKPGKQKRVSHFKLPSLRVEKNPATDFGIRFWPVCSRLMIFGVSSVV